MRNHVGRRHHGGQDRHADDHIAPRRHELRAGNNSGAVEQEQQDRQQEADPEGQDELHHQAEVVAGARQRLQLHPALVAFKAKEEPESRGHDHEIGQRRTGAEQDRGGQQEGQERLLFLGVEPGRDKGPKLVGDHRKGDEERGEQRHFQLHEERLVQLGIDQLALTRRESFGQRADQDREDIVGEIEADDECRRQRIDAAQQARAQFNQVVEQRRLRLVNVLDLEHHQDCFPPSGCFSASGAVACSGLSAAPGVVPGSGPISASSAVAGGWAAMIAAFCSRHFFSISASSASRIMVSTPARKWPEMRRTLPIQRPAVRSAIGKSLGPITTIARTTISSSSEAPTSNMGKS